MGQGFLRQVLRGPTSCPCLDAHALTLLFWGRSGCCLPDEVIEFQGLAWNWELGIWRLAAIREGKGRVHSLRAREEPGLMALPPSHVPYQGLGCSNLSACLSQTPEHRTLSPGLSRKYSVGLETFSLLTFIQSSFQPTNLWGGSVLNREMGQIS